MSDTNFDFNLTSLRDKLNNLNNMAAKAATTPIRVSNLDDDEHKTSAGKDSAGSENSEGSKAVNTDSYASKLKNVGPTINTSGKQVNFRFFPSQSDIAGIDLVIPMESVKEINSRFSNVLYGYFLGNRLAFPVVENYVKNTWAKFGLQRMMMNDTGFFFFQFSSKKGLEQVLEKGPWLIRSTPILLNIWTPNVCLAKQDITKIPVWVKIYDVPLVAFTEDGLSMIASKIGNPLMLDSYTSQMCVSSWGRHNYARALIELNALETPRESLVIAVPNFSGEGFSKHEISVDYEWKPPHCDNCKVFGHEKELCPRQTNVVKEAVKPTQDDGFIAVARRKGKGNERQVEGIRLTKPKPQFVYRPKQPNAGHFPPASNKTVNPTDVSAEMQNLKSASSSSSQVDKKKLGASSSVHVVNRVSTIPNPTGFKSGKKDGASTSTDKPIDIQNIFSVLGSGEDSDDDDEVEVIYDESSNKG